MKKIMILILIIIFSILFIITITHINNKKKTDVKTIKTNINEESSLKNDLSKEKYYIPKTAGKQQLP